jgi:D-glycerate 3-kinase
MDCWLMLKAPSFDCVYQWRLEQEQKLQARLAQQAQVNVQTQGRSQEQTQTTTDTSGVMSSAEIQRFIQFYQRITEQLLTTLPDWADVVWSLSDQRQIQSCLSRNTFSHLEGEQV